MERRRFLAGLVGVGAGAVAGCVGAFPTDETGTAPRPATVETTGAGVAVAYTSGRASGNRVAAGRGAVDTVAPVDVSLSGTPAWLVAGVDAEGAATNWVVAHEDGGLEAVRVVDGEARVGAVTPPRLPAGTPPALVPAENRVLAPPNDASTLTHPTPTPAGSILVGADGTLHVGETAHAVDALPDARVVVGDEYAAVLAGATRQYDHGALGDGVEASAVAVVSLPDGDDPQTSSKPPDVSTFPVARGVVEGTSPILVDVTGDGTRDVLVTESDADAGARIVAYDTDGRVLARGPAVGSGYRWRHQLAVAPFGPDDTTEVAVVKTPHIGGTVEFYRRDGDRFRIAATASGYSSHSLGSRNLDGARALDADGDGRVELVVPTDDRQSLAVVARTDDGARETARRSLGGRLAGNLATATVDGATTLGATTADGRLRIWPA